MMGLSLRTIPVSMDELEHWYVRTLPPLTLSRYERTAVRSPGIRLGCGYYWTVVQCGRDGIVLRLSAGDISQRKMSYGLRSTQIDMGRRLPT